MTDKKPANWLVAAFLYRKGRPLAAMLVLVLTFSYWLQAPVIGSISSFNDRLQQLAPRERVSSPVTIVEVDEASLKMFGQWPWPRDRLAALLDAINAYAPAAIGLDFYMPEPDATSPDQLAQRLAEDYPELAAQLAALPNNDDTLAISLFSTPSVLGAAGFDFETMSTTKGLRVTPPTVNGGDAIAHVRQYPYVLASLPKLQSAAVGQALLSVDLDDGVVRHVPLLGAIHQQTLVPALALEMLRVGLGVDNIQVDMAPYGVDAVRIGELEVPVQPNGEIWLHFANADTGRYVPAHQLLTGEAVDPDLLTSKLVLISLTGVGLTDYRATPLKEYVPGVEIQAQVIESLFDGTVVLRPWFITGMEIGFILFGGLLMIVIVPRLSTQFSLVFTFGLQAISFAIGYALFRSAGWLVDSSAILVALTLLYSALRASVALDGVYELKPRAPADA